jgi:hypothetical protein
MFAVLNAFASTPIPCLFLPFHLFPSISSSSVIGLTTDGDEKDGRG